LVLADEARASARVVDDQVAAGEDPGALAGVPVALKDNLCTRGVATTCSSRILAGWDPPATSWKPPYTATVVDRIAAAGGVVIAGHDPLDSTSIPGPVRPVVPTLDEGVDGLRIGVIAEMRNGIDADVLARVSAAADVLTAAGAKVDEVSVPAVSYGLTAYYLIAPAEASS